MSPTKKKIKKLVKKSFWRRVFKRRRAKIMGAFSLFTFFCLFWIFWGIPLPKNLTTPSAVSTKLFDRSGALIYEIYADEQRSPVKLAELPQSIKDATLSIEDKNFYKHSGFDIAGMIRGVSRQFTRGRAQGGSTLTQQLVKNSLLSPERTIRRKIRELVLSLLVEIRFSKDQIFEMYLNQIPYGGTAYGIGAASQVYFNKEAKDLTLAESSLLAGLPAAPSRYSPFGAHPELAKERQRLVLRRMVEDGHLSQEEADKAYEEELVFAQQQSLKAPHFVLWIKDQLAEKYGDALVEQGGLRVTTTLDLELQEFAQDAVATEVGKLTKLDVGNGAAIVTRPHTGEILAMVGSKDYFAQDEDGKVNIIFAKRQPGSSIKPLNYALAIKDNKITASTPLADVPTCFSVAGQEIYCPQNYDGQFHGLTQTRFALGNSYNVPAVRVLALNGMENFVSFAFDMGISTFTDPKNYGLSLTLGGGEVLPADMAVAYGVFANEGIKVPLHGITKVEDWNGKVLYEYQEVDDGRILDPSVTFIMSQMLLDNNARIPAFGDRSLLNVSGHPEVSVKTGTTNDRRDNWTIGYTADAVVVSWVGNNDNSPMKGAVSGVSGASPIWNKIMKFTLDKAEKGAYTSSDKGHKWPKQPGDVTGANICATSGGLPEGEAASCPMRFEYFVDGTVPKIPVYRQDIPVDRTTQAPAGSKTPPENIEMRGSTVLTDPLGTILCLTCAIPTDHVTIRYPL